MTLALLFFHFNFRINGQQQNTIKRASLIFSIRNPVKIYEKQKKKIQKRSDIANDYIP